jgi:hypothetical protein
MILSSVLMMGLQHILVLTFISIRTSLLALIKLLCSSLLCYVFTHLIRCLVCHSCVFDFFIPYLIGTHTQRGCLNSRLLQCICIMVLAGETQSTWRGTCPTATLSTINSMWTGPRSNPVSHSDRLATNHLKHGMMTPPTHTHPPHHTTP